MAAPSIEGALRPIERGPAPEPGLLVVALFGDVTADIGSTRIQFRRRKTRALFGYLALSETGTETRERLVGLLWSESDEEKGRGSLRQALRELREVCALARFHGIHSDKAGVRLDLEAIQVDVSSVVRAVEAFDLPPRLLNTNRLTDTLLSGLDDLDPAFRVWLLARRQTLHDRLVRALEAGMTNPNVSSAVQGRMAEAALLLDPTHEVACRLLMRMRAEAGDIAGALRAYKSLWDLLDDEYDMEPSAPTQDLVADIKSGRIEPRRLSLPGAVELLPPSATSPSLPARSLPSGRLLPARFVLQVEPFSLGGIGSDKAHLVDGFRQHLIACLVRFREWYVTDRALPPRTDATLPALATQYAVQAMAIQSGDAVSLVLTMKELPSELYIWSDRLVVQIDKWFEAQQAIVRRIAVALNVHLSAERLARSASHIDAAPEVYDRWLYGQHLILRHHPTDWQRAAELFHDIIGELPSFAPAYSSLVQLYNSMHLVHPGLYRDRERQQLALNLAKTATQLDPLDSRALLCLGWAQAMAKQYEQAEVNLGLAYDLNENDPWTLISSAHGFGFCGDHRRARELADQALNLSLAPSQIHWGYQVGIRFLSGDYAGCVEAANRAGTVIPNLPGWKAAALAQLGRHDEAAAEFREFVEYIRSKWLAPEPPTEPAVTRWFLHLFPIRLPEDWERLRAGLGMAGATTHSARHHGW